MNPMQKNIMLLLAVMFLPGVIQLRAQSVSIVAAENFYGGVAAQVAGSSAKVTSIMSNPNQDPMSSRQMPPQPKPWLMPIS